MSSVYVNNHIRKVTSENYFDVGILLKRVLSGLSLRKLRLKTTHMYLKVGSI